MLKVPVDQNIEAIIHTVGSVGTIELVSTLPDVGGGEVIKLGLQAIIAVIALIKILKRPKKK